MRNRTPPGPAPRKPTRDLDAPIPLRPRTMADDIRDELIVPAEPESGAARAVSEAKEYLGREARSGARRFGADLPPSTVGRT